MASADELAASHSAPLPATQDSPTLPPYASPTSMTMSDIVEPAAAVANGVPPSRASPQVPHASVPNGKPTSPYVKESNPMGSGAAQTVSSKDPKAAAAAASDMRNVVRRKLTGYVGFANLPNQWHRKSVRKGFNFNVMVVGTSRIFIVKRWHTNTNRRVWSWKVYTCQYPLQHFPLPASGTQRPESRHHPKDRLHPVHQRRH